MIKIILISLNIFILISCSNKFNNSNKISNENVIILNNHNGSGEKIKNHYKISIHYKGMLENGTIFDSTYKRNNPFTFQYGLRQVIEGLEIGLENSQVGSKRTIKIPPDLAYGKKGIKNLIPPNSTLIFELEILKIEKHDYMIITPEILSTFKYERILDFNLNRLILIDIREKKDVLSTGIIKDSFHLETFNSKGNINSNFVKEYKAITRENDHVVIISQNGDFSSILANGLVENLGMKNIYTLKGGISRWVGLGKTLIK